MPCCGAETEDHFPKKRGSGPGNSESQARTHTDTPCAVLFILCIVSMVLTVGYSFHAGNFQRLTHPMDFNGRLCGVGDMVNKSYLYYCGSQEWQGEFPTHLRFDSKSCVEFCPNATTQLEVPCLMENFHNFTELPGDSATEPNGLVVTFVSTLNVEITQSVTKQKSYPTKLYKNKFCLPQYRSNISLYQDVINGPLKNRSRLTNAVAGFRHAWPVVLGAALLACILGLTYLFLLKSHAGLLIFGSLCVCTILMGLLGLFFLCGFFANSWDEEGWYQQLNPIFGSFFGFEAQAYTCSIGFIFLAVCVCMGFTTYFSMEKIDESIGVIQAACDCLWNSPGLGKWDLLIKPLIESAIVVVVMVIVFLGFMLVCTVGYVDGETVTLNSEPVEWIHKEYKHYSWFKPVMGLYIFSSMWLIEFIINFGQFVVIYAVCLWFFVPNDEPDSDDDQNSAEVRNAYGNVGRPVSGIKVLGIDNVEGGERPGRVEMVNGAKVLVVPIGKRGPDGRDFLPSQARQSTKTIPLGSTIRGVCIGLFYHLGSIAWGSIVITVTRPFRWVSQIIKALLGKADERGGMDEDEQSRAGIIAAGFGLLSGLMDNIFGGFSKSAYAEIILSSSSFWTAANDSLDFVAEAGGVVAFLHGGTAMYEMIGVAMIGTICGCFTFIMLTRITMFRATDSPYYVDEPWMMTVMSTGLCSMIAFGFMSLFNVTADTLLYVFAWSRRHHCNDIEQYCPDSLRNLVSDEMDDQPEEIQLQARSKNKLTRFQHAATRYAGNVMSTMGTSKGTSAEKKPFLSSTGMRQ